ncbi:RHS repeat-associated core domain-containing protein [Lysobacter capsici]|uniref:RHS repeat-associated core domain-containing protein n=1 Tax=Lysobacter capsici TaxID=435897 RepID=UPI0009E25221|nr:RHS repeat-associated core domain-containing protein [Lysobacter capsici]
MNLFGSCRCWLALMLLFVVSAANAQIIPGSEGMWYYPSSLAGGGEECRTPEVYGATPEEVAILHMRHNNAVTTMECFQTCNNPYTHLRTEIVSDALAKAYLKSNCTGSTYSYDIVKKKSPKPPGCTNEGQEDAGQGTAGNPCNLGTGNKVQAVTDYRDASGDLTLARYYNSGSTNTAYTPLGPKWQFSYGHRGLGFNRPVAASLVQQMDALFWRPGGNAIFFRYDAASASWKGDPDVSEQLTQLIAPSGLHDGWILSTRNSGAREIYDAAGRPVRFEDISGTFNWLTYDSGGQLSKVTDRTGRSITFVFNSNKRLTKAVLPDGGEVTYNYISGMFSWVTYPDATPANSTDNHWVQYHYEKPGQPQLLTGIVDENGNRSSTWDYDAENRVSLSTHGNASSTTDRVAIFYADDGSVTLTQPLGAITTVNFEALHGVRRLSGQSGLCPSCNGGQIKKKTFDSNGYPDIVTDFRGTQTNYDYNAAGLVTQKIQAANDTDGAKRTIQTDWNIGLRVPLQRRLYDASSALLRTDVWTHNVRGQVLAQSQSDGTATRTSTTTYCEQSDIDAGTCPLLGLVLSVNGPRTDLADIKTFVYYASDDVTCAASSAACQHRKGDLWKVTDALGHAVEFLRYDGSGRPLSVKDSNGVITDIEYMPRGWIGAAKVRGPDDGVETEDQIIRFEYWPVGTVKGVTLPDGSRTSYAYDVAKRLTDIVDIDGNTIHYTLDNAGNRKQEDTKTASGALKRTLSRIYNALGQLQAQKDASQNATTFGYDANGNLNSSTDALGRVTNEDQDPLNRLSRTLQDTGGLAVETKFAYDAFDQIAKVTDPKGLNTTYGYNGFGELIQLSSPDTGVTVYTYDSAGNRSSQTDARGITSIYGYDALNRLSGVSYPTASLNTTYGYDIVQNVCTADETFAKGRLTLVTDASGSTQYCYDRFGRVVRKVQTTNGKVFAVRYAYTLAGQLSSVTYPDGAVVSYQRDAQGRVSQVDTKRAAAGATTEALLSQAAYHPFGPVSGWTYGNGRTLARPVDLDYRTTAVTDPSAGGLSVGFSFDVAGNLNQLTPAGSSTSLLKYDYDGLDRLTHLRDGPSNTPIETYSYDATGNRLSLTQASGTQTYVYPATSHRLAQVGNSGLRGYDASGNTTDIDANSFVYNDAGRMSQLKQSGVLKMTYLYNGLGEQVRKYTDTYNRYMVYDESGHWLGEYDSNGATIQQAIWMDDLPVGVLADGGAQQKLHYVEPDHLGTPRVVIDPVRNVAVWNWDLKGEAFGNSAPNQDPDLDGTAFVFDMRFPGQLYDGANGLNYNYFRNYDPASGRYVQSDPIGLIGGLNTYSYVRGNPANLVDPLGLQDAAFLRLYDAYMRHYYRNALNVVPANKQAALAAGNWSQMSSAQSVFHQQGKNGKDNTKWVDDSGRCEAVYDGQGDLVTDYLNGGTYNYASPYENHGYDHLMLDVLPYLLWGNGPIVVNREPIVVRP